MKDKTIKGFKAFNKGLICKGYKFEEGKKYKHGSNISMCNSGFHFLCSFKFILFTN